MKNKIIKVIVFLITIIISMYYTIKWLDTFSIVIDDDTLNILLESSNNISQENRIINKIVNTIKYSDIVNPVSIIVNKYYTKTNIEKEQLIPVNTASQNSPIVYIYNTHQGEKYSSSKEINISYSVLDASFLLQEKLRKYGIESIVETSSINDVLKTNNWNYASSYRVSRMFLEKSKKENPTLTYFIDLHRDSVNKKISTIEINGKQYAKTMFLLGLENEKYKLNEAIITKMENYLNKNYPGLSRGIYKKQGKGVNGVYNQDFSSFCLLIEVGGEENNIEEVENTITVIAEMINKYIGGDID